MAPALLRARQRLGKYKIVRRLGQGGFAAVYLASDTVEGIKVALKIPHAHLVNPELLNLFQREARTVAQLDHPHILALKNADFIDGRFVLVYPAGEETLGARMQRRMRFDTIVEYSESLLDGLAYAHAQRIVHCDVNPENLILMPDGRLCLTDFGVAKVAQKTEAICAGGTGTLGYLAPEQAMGFPSFRSDVFSAGLVLYRMFLGQTLSWPFDWPTPSPCRSRPELRGGFETFLRKAVHPEPKKRFRDAGTMLGAFVRLKPRLRSKQARPRPAQPKDEFARLRTLRHKAFRRAYGKVLELSAACRHCQGPIGGRMAHCPWCSKPITKFRGELRFPRRCERCGRGMKRDWRFCAHCYGPKVEAGPYVDSDQRYTGRCGNPKCERKQLMPFSRYCPWCRTKVKQAWPIPDAKHRCSKCRWGIVKDVWSFCAWCGSRT